MKVGIYGGSFNPVHIAHRAMVESLLESKVVDEVWLVPCKDHAFKNGLVNAGHRVEMLKRAFKDKHNVKIDFTEIETKGKSYSANTMRHLKDKHSHDFYFVLGTDAVNEIESWHDYNYLKNNVNFLLVSRPGYVYESRNINLETILNPLHDVSSTEIRERVKNNESIKGLVCEGVEKYIHEQKLYQKEDVKNKDFVNPGSVVDLIVPYKEGYVFIKRKHEPFKGFWSFPGGYLDCGKETLEEAAVRELEEETSLIASVDDLRLVGVYSGPLRDPRGHNISHVYEVLKFSGELKANDDALDARVFKYAPKNLAFDHLKIFNDYKKSFGGEL